MKFSQFKELLLQSLTHEKGGVMVYRTALGCAVHTDLQAEWARFLEQTERHVRILTDVCTRLEIDPNEVTPGCKVVEHTGHSLVKAMQMATASGDAAAAQIVACECVVLAEVKDHADWELLGECAKAVESAEAAKVLQAAVDEVEEQEDEHLYQTKGWCRELWLDSLGLQAVLPPPEETNDVRSAAEAAKTETRRKKVSKS